MQGTESLTAGRFVLEERLGSGGMGVVYAALDRRRGTRVALKKLKHFDADGLFRFKNEFRALADLVHPNLVTLHELVSVDGEWAFTMELIEGVDFLRYVRPLPSGASVEILSQEAVTVDADGLPTRPIRPRAHDSAGVRVSPVLPRLLGPLSLVRLRSALSQLAQGILFLHAAGKLHRDIKPSNILVTPDDRVVLSDFGLVVDVRPTHSLHPPDASDGSGTPEYMSPEQLEGLPLSEASDWYAVGTLLYHCLTGGPPFRGSTGEIARLKRTSVPPAPSVLVPTTPPDLDSLCAALLRREPEARPLGADVLRWLGVEPNVALPRPLVAPFVGREGALRTLHGAFTEVRRGTPRRVLLHGGPGMGKSALAHRFLEEVRTREQAVVLASRCYESESVPYKGVDGLVDALVVCLLAREQHLPQRLRRVDALALVRLFPVLRRLPAFAGLPLNEEPGDLPEPRRHAFEALRQLLSALGRRCPLVLFVDDLQWGDRDSAALLGHVLRGRDAPPVLFLGCYRTEEGEGSPLVETLLHLDRAEAAGVVQGFAVAPLSADESRLLIESLAGRSVPPLDLQALTEEAQGNPYLLDELVRFESDGGTQGEEAFVSRDRLARVLRRRLDALSPQARVLMDVVTVGGPVPREVAAQASELGDQEAATLALLRAQRLLRVRTQGDTEALEPYHDRLRETSLGALEEGRRQALHRQVALAYEATGSTQWERLYEHWLGAGERLSAARYAMLAAQRAMEALAFERAVQLYRTACDLGGSEGIHARLADALAAAGKGAEAAAEYLAACEGATPQEQRKLKRGAVDQLLCSGRVDEGLALLRGLLEEVGERLPLGPREALFSLMRDRLYLRVRGLRYRPRRQPAASPLTESLELYQSVAGLTFVDPILAAAFHCRRLVLGLRSGDRAEAAWGFASEAVNLASLSSQRRKRVEMLWSRSEALARGIDVPHLQALLLGCRALMLHLFGHWRRGLELFNETRAISRRVPEGGRWVEASCTLFGLLALGHVGEFEALSQQAPQVLQDAIERGDVYAETVLRVTTAYLNRLVRDEPDAARAELRAADRRWAQKGFHMQHYHRLNSEVKVCLYEGDARSAYLHAMDQLEACHRVYLDRVELVRIFGGHVRGLASLALGREDPSERLARVKDGLAAAASIEATQARWAQGMAQVLRAGASVLLRDEAGAIQQAETAIQLLESNDMPLYAQGARFRLGELVGGERGNQLQQQAQEWLMRQGVRRAERFTLILAPDLRPVA
jgi:hypothetical protein